MVKIRMSPIHEPAKARIEQRRPEAGYTLIEVLVAFLVVAATAQLALSVFGGQGRQIATNEQIMLALEVSETAVAELELLGVPAQLQTAPKQVNGLWWQASFTPEYGSGQDYREARLYSITVSVFTSPDKADMPITQSTTKRVFVPASGQPF